MQLDKDEGAKEEVEGDKEKLVASEENSANMATTEEKEGGEDEAGMIDAKESTVSENDGGDGLNNGDGVKDGRVNVDNGMHEETRSTSAAATW